MCWMVAISCKAYEVDGMGTVLFLIRLGTEISISLQPGGEALCTGAEALQASSEKSNHVFLRNPTCMKSGERV